MSRARTKPHTSEVSEHKLLPLASPMRTPSSPELASLSESDDGDRPSITEVNGTVAHFEMAYSPVESDRFRFGPPFSQRIGSLLFLAAAIGLVVAIGMAYAGVGGSRLRAWVLEEDGQRVIGATSFATLLLISAVGTVVRAGMRGIVVTAEGIEARYILPMGIPRVRKWSWSQIDRFLIDEASTMLELWDGTYEQLPKVAEKPKLDALLQRIAAARGKRVTVLRDDVR